MKKLLIAALCTVTLAFLFYGCEKDDICVDAVTPRLIIQFYDKDDFSELKSVTLLKVIGEGENQAVYLNDSQDSVLTTNEIALPLKTLENTTSFVFITNYGVDSDGNEVGNRDTITFHYSRNELYVSRACGYKVNYSDLTKTLVTDGDNWISNVVIENSDVLDETATHVYIYH